MAEYQLQHGAIDVELNEKVEASTASIEFGGAGQAVKL